MKTNVIELYPDGENVYRTKHFYRDNVQAMFDHMFNMINTYGKDQVANVVRELIALGAFNEDRKKD